MFDLCSFLGIWNIMCKNMGRQTACKPGFVHATAHIPRRVLVAIDDHSSRTSVAGRLVQPTRTAARTRLSRNAETSPNAPSLFGFAPGGVYRAAIVTNRAVRSYRTLSPLPDYQDQSPGGRAVCFLWHFP